MAETAIIVPVHAVEPVTGAIYRAHTKAGAEGAPPHITLLYPFTDSAQLAVARVREAADVIAGFSAFAYELTVCRYFDIEPRTLYLAPEPSKPFEAMTAALVARFPEHPPYGGEHDEVVPHLSVARAGADVLADAERRVSKALPIAARATEAWLIQRDDAGTWNLRERLPLGSSPR